MKKIAVTFLIGLFSMVTYAASPYLENDVDFEAENLIHSCAALKFAENKWISLESLHSEGKLQPCDFKSKKDLIIAFAKKYSVDDEQVKEAGNLVVQGGYFKELYDQYYEKSMSEFMLHSGVESDLHNTLCGSCLDEKMKKKKSQEGTEGRALRAELLINVSSYLVYIRKLKERLPNFHLGPRMGMDEICQEITKQLEEYQNKIEHCSRDCGKMGFVKIDLYD